jgi:hypothetical protein
MLVLLDIDGVMVPAKSWQRPELLKDGFPAFSNKAVDVLNNSLSKDDTIVLTTSHKANFTITEWKQIFKNRGVNILNFNTLPENIHNLTRKEEILNWFQLNKVEENFVILDDDKSLNDLPPFLKQNLIQTSSIIGLTLDHLEAIKAILLKGFQPA